MKGVVPNVPPETLARRKRTGIDKFDEMWDGVLHMTPAPKRSHQNFEWEFEAWLRFHWARPFGNRVYHAVNVAAPGKWPDDYRIPDLVLLTPDRFEIDRNDYFDGARRLSWRFAARATRRWKNCRSTARIGVPEAWVVDRDTRAGAVRADRRPVCAAVAGSRWLAAQPGDER